MTTKTTSADREQAIADRQRYRRFLIEAVLMLSIGLPTRGRKVA